MAERADADEAFSQIRTTLSKLCAIEVWTASTATDPLHPFAPRFCWEFFRADPDTLANLGRSLNSYKGGVAWVFGPSDIDGTCLVAAQHGRGQLVGYPPITANFPSSTQLLAPADAEFIERAVADIASLCAQKYLGLEHAATKVFDPGLAAPADPPSPTTPAVDFVERGVHVHGLFRTTQQTDVCSTSASPRRSGKQLRPTFLAKPVRFPFSAAYRRPSAPVFEDRK
jgi:hypothetical protein